MPPLAVQMKNNHFLVNQKPVQIISGAIHYFRILPELWEDRLLKAKQCGLNTIETYMCWNLHEPEEGRFDFTGLLDFEKFIQIAGDLGLMVIIRPGPYICSEWDLGGLPSWLLVKNGISLRCSNEPYLEAVNHYFGIILKKLKRLQHTEGGPIIAMQVENEYGSFGMDKEYLYYLRDLIISNDITVPLFTSDGADNHYIQGGTLPDVLATLNFGSKPVEAFKKGREYRPDGPDFCMEFWNGWFDHWGEKHHSRNVKSAAKVLDKMLSAGASVNIYMFHGGTNYNFWNGANENKGKYQPTITSYDSDAPLNESGDPTEKYFAYQRIISKHNPTFKIEKPESLVKKAYGKVNLTEADSLLDCLDVLSKKQLTLETQPMEYFGQNFGFIHYRTQLSGPVNENLRLIGVHDRAQIFLDGKPIATVSRNDKKQSLPVSIPPEGAQLDILVENMGRINYGPFIQGEIKGLIGGGYICLQKQFNWETWPLPLDNLDQLSFGSKPRSIVGPGFYKGTFNVDSVHDTFLKIPHGNKGVAWINGFNLGRYWDIGPQQTLYVPNPLLRIGLNEVVLFELHGFSEHSVELVANHQLEN